MLPVSLPGSSDATRERILDAAVALFAASGYEATAVRAIVQRAGTNLNSINYHFGGKLGLYKAVLQRELARAASFTAQLPQLDAAAGVDVTPRRNADGEINGVRVGGSASLLPSFEIDLFGRLASLTQIGRAHV